MKVDIENIAACKKKVSVVIDPDKVKVTYNNLFKKYANKGSVQGFRKGNAPEHLVENKYGQAISQELQEQLLQGSVYDVLKENKIEPVLSPLVESIKNEPKNCVFSFTLLVDVKPKIKLKDYKGLKLEKEVFSITEKQMQEAFKNLQENYANYNLVEDRPLKKIDYCVADLKLSVEEQVLKDQKDAWICVEEKSLLPGVFDAVVDMKIGESKDIPITIPEDFFDKQYVGKQGLFSITVKEIKEKQLPTLDDEFAKDLGVESLDKLKEALTGQLKNNSEQQSRQKLEEDILKKLVSDNDFEIPAALLEQQTHHLMHEAKNGLKSKGLKDKDIADKEKEIKEQSEKQARDIVKIQFILDEIEDRENLKVQKEEIDQKIEEMAGWMKKNKNVLLKEMQEKGTLNRLYSQLRHQKIFDFLIKEGRIKEKAIKN